MISFYGYLSILLLLHLLYLSQNLHYFLQHHHPIRKLRYSFIYWLQVFLFLYLIIKTTIKFFQTYYYFIATILIFYHFKIILDIIMFSVFLIQTMCLCYCFILVFQLFHLHFCYYYLNVNCHCFI